MKNVLVTGARGFIGFNAIQRWLEQDPSMKIVGVDKLTYADKFMLKEKEAWLDSHDVKCFTLDLASPEAVGLVANWCQQFDIDTIVDFHAESHVDNSISNPSVFFQANVIGTTNLLEVARKLDLRFHYVSTDEAVGAISPEEVESGKKIADETAPYDPSSPYSASKAGSELAVKCYTKTFGVKATISRCTNNFGPWQHPEKLIPLSLKMLLSGKKVPVYGDGLQRRYWIHVNQHVDALKAIIMNGKPDGSIYNIAPSKSNLKTNIELVKLLIASTVGPNKESDCIEHVTDRLAHDNCYWLESNLMHSIGWSDTGDFEKDLQDTINWYRKVIANVSK